jgi:DNA-binding transcriptional MerR regulator
MQYTISQAAEKTGLSSFTLRYYDKEGLLPFVKKNKNGIRIFSDEDMKWLGLVTCMKTIGMQVKEIKQYIVWCREGDKTLQKRHDMFVEKKADTLRQIAELKQCLKKLDYKLWYYDTALKAGTEAVHKQQMLDMAGRSQCMKAKTAKAAGRPARKSASA